MKKLIQSMVFSAGLLFGSMSNATPIIFFDSTPEFGSVGDTISVDIMWDGSGGIDYISAWDVDISWDSSILTYSSTSFHTGVDSFGCIPAFTCDAALLAPGLLDIYEFSFDSVTDLMMNQDGLGNMFSLATIEFTAIADGVTSLLFDGQLLAFGDENGGAISPDLVNGLVCIGSVNQNCANVPEPSTLPLLLLLVGGLVSARVKWRKH